MTCPSNVALEVLILGALLGAGAYHLACRILQWATLGDIRRMRDLLNEMVEARKAARRQ